MTSMRAIILAVFLLKVIGLTYFQPEWSPAPLWARHLVFGVTTVRISKIDVCPPRCRLTGVMKFLVETIVVLALLEVLPNGVWWRFEPLIHRYIRTVCFDLGMDLQQYLEAEYWLLGWVTTTVALMMSCIVIATLKWIQH
ncbi:uncharacterized protein [Drosophila pseudoobscura]|uniref:Uncharacterized protein n=1 Tax=Drosophila pseudoobscura pseudoobscura TaxID=46245 RepID=A0A6I8VHU9_DROPS|nr:uncharacterized protein LOC26533829 [Drosophila pseudoobscura]